MTMKNLLQAKVVGHYSALQTMRSSPFPVSHKSLPLNCEDTKTLMRSCGSTDLDFQKSFIKGWNSAVDSMPMGFDDETGD